MKIEKTDVKRILVIKLRAIGDVLLSTAVLRNLRVAFPDASIDFLTEVPSREVLEGNPDVSSLLIFDGKKQSGAGLILDVRRRRYDLVIDLFGNPRSALVTLFSGAKYRVGYRFGWRRYCYNIVVHPRGGEVHNVEFNLDALRSIDVPVHSAEPVFPLSTQSETFAEDYFRKSALAGKHVVAFNPGGGWYTKRWRVSQFAQLGERLVKQFNVRVIVIWGPGERDDAEQVIKLGNFGGEIIPPTSLKQLASILKRCSSIVTNDSGPMHIAAAMGIPVVAIFGPTRPELQGPLAGNFEVVRHQELSCLGCNLTKCPIGNPCMEDLSVEKVFEAFKRVMERAG